MNIKFYYTISSYSCFVGWLNWILSSLPTIIMLLPTRFDEKQASLLHQYLALLLSKNEPGDWLSDDICKRSCIWMGGYARDAAGMSADFRQFQQCSVMN